MSITAKFPSKQVLGQKLSNIQKIPLFSIVFSHYDVIARRQKIQSTQIFYATPIYGDTHSVKISWQSDQYSC